MVLTNKKLDTMLEDIDFQEIAVYHIIEEDEFSYWSQGRFKEIEEGIPFFNKDLSRVVGNALENAQLEGNHDYSPYKDGPMISLKVFVGKKGLVIRIRDSGQGFNFQQTISNFNKWKENERLRREGYFKGPNPNTIYSTSGGFGFKAYDDFQGDVAFEGNGSIVNIMYKLS